MTTTLDTLMEQASEALTLMDYCACEDLCVQALGEARQLEDWAYYARILLPLQETRRQRRMIAAEGTIRLGTSDLGGDVNQWLAQFDEGCIVLTHPYQTGDAQRLAQLTHDQSFHIEVMFADCDADADHWVLTTFAGQPVTCEIGAPEPRLRNRWLNQGDATGSDDALGAEWFLAASEKLGDAALAAADGMVKENPDDSNPHQCKLLLLEAALSSVQDHEILHQRLAEAARAACLDNY